MYLLPNIVTVSAVPQSHRHDNNNLEMGRESFFPVVSTWTSRKLLVSLNMDISWCIKKCQYDFKEIIFSFSLYLFVLYTTAFINETTGSDETGSGTRESPYKTAVTALQKHGSHFKVFVWKTEENEFKPISDTALKKAKKRVDDIARKQKKLEEQNAAKAEKERLKQEEELKKIEEAKSIVLKEDSSLPTAKKVRMEFLDDRSHR